MTLPHFAFPFWALFAICGAAISAGCMLLQERYKVNGFALAFWNKIGCILTLAPFVIIHGFPTNLLFYALTFASALLYAVSDVVYFSGIGKVGAGTVSRVIPVSIIFSFLLWLAIEPSSLQKFIAAPGITSAIFGVLCLWVWFTSHLRKCEVSVNAAKTVWFVIFAAIIGPPLSKKIFELIDTNGVYAFVFTQALLMVLIWAFYFWLRKPVSSATLRARHAWQNGLIIGVMGAFSVIFGNMALFYVDNPAYSTAVSLLNSIFILGVYKAIGRKNDGNVRAGIGMVACAAVLIILKSWI